MGSAPAGRAWRERPRRYAQVDGPAPTPGAAGATTTAVMEATTPLSMLDAHLSEMMGDAPFCDVCGHITVRNGACYKCLNCGNSLGRS